MNVIEWTMFVVVFVLLLSIFVYVGVNHTFHTRGHHHNILYSHRNNNSVEFHYQSTLLKS